MDGLISLKNSAIAFSYQNVLKRIYFKLDPELVHDRMTLAGRILGTNPVTRTVTKSLFYYSHPMLEQKILGIKFSNPVGLAAGFDKEARLTGILPEVGFGFEEVGSVTGEPCEGNPKPRLWRLPESKALIVNYGLKSSGAEAISKRLANSKFNFPVGVSITKTNSPITCDDQKGVEDYAKGFELFKNIGDYLTINISCPNAFGGQPFHEAGRLNKLLQRLSKIPVKKPVFLKISPNLSKAEVDKIIDLSLKYKLDGLICSNLTKDRTSKKIKEKKLPGPGGISGKVVEDLSDELIAYTYRKSKGKLVIIGCGGIFSAEDAYRKIRLGASLVQMVTGMIYQGPQVIGQINFGLVKLLKRDGLTNTSQAIGLDNRL